MFRLKFLPARFGDAIWIEYGDPKKPHIVLIDGGTAGTRRAIQAQLRSLPAPTPHLDLLVVSHIDRDHIEGVLTLLEQPQPGFTVDDLWFNGRHHLTEVPELSYGPLHGERLSDRLRELADSGWRWNAEFKGHSVCVPPSAPLPAFTLDGGMRVTLLTPDRQALLSLLPSWEKEIRAANLDPTDHLPANDDLPPEPLAYGIEELPDVESLANAPFQEDNSPANASSISLLAEYQGRRLLLAADAHPGALLRSLERLVGEDRLQVDCCKIPHHGSRNNTSLALLEKLECPMYVFSTNGASFKHPDREAVARVITAGGERPELVFNYCSPHNQVWEQPELQAVYRYKTRYPPGKTQGIEIDLSSTRLTAGVRALNVLLQKEAKMGFTQGHALVIGVGSYQHAPYANVPRAVVDARAVERVLMDERLCAYPPSQVEFLEDATRQLTLEALERLAGRVGQGDTVFLFYVGHGALGTDGNFYLVSQDAQLHSGQVAAGSGVSEAELITRLRQLKARRALLVFNTCFSGSISPSFALGDQSFEPGSLPEDTASALLDPDRERMIITACREQQKSYLGDGELSIFTQALVDGLRGRGVGNSAGYISAYHLYECVYDGVTQAVEEQFTGLQQQPELTVIKGVGPFPVALYKGASALGEFDASQPIPQEMAVRQVKAKAARKAYQIKVGSGAVAIGEGAKAAGEGAIIIEGNVGGDVIASGGKKKGKK